jgi:hypothetical protein
MIAVELDPRPGDGGAVSDGVSGSRVAAASMSAALIGASGSTGNASSVPSGLTRTKEPSRRILAKVDVLLMLGSPARRDDPNARVPFRVDGGQYLAVLHSQEDDPLFAVGSPVIDLLDGERIAECR